MEHVDQEANDNSGSFFCSHFMSFVTTNEPPTRTVMVVILRPFGATKLLTCDRPLPKRSLSRSVWSTLISHGMLAATNAIVSFASDRRLNVCDFMWKMLMDLVQHWRKQL